jgi:SRSO17 transposase
LIFRKFSTKQGPFAAKAHANTTHNIRHKHTPTAAKSVKQDTPTDKDDELLTTMAKRLMNFCSDFSDYFSLHERDAHARRYLSGLLGTQRRKNMERIDAELEGGDYQSMQQFIADSPWDHAPLMARIAHEADGLLGGQRNSALYLDETSFVKKGEASVAVQRQYCGRLGKVENCQVAVFACLGSGERAALTGMRLFLPQAWAEDARRCQKAKIPLGERKHRTKAQLALELVGEMRANGLRFGWIGGDEVYGCNRELTDALERAGERYLMDVSSNYQVCEHDPEVCEAQAGPRQKRRGNPGKKTLVRRESGQQSVGQLCKKYFEKESRKVEQRESTRGMIRRQAWARKVWLPATEGSAARACLLVVRREEDGSYKYSLGNIVEEVRLERLIYMQGQRYFIERAFQDAKSELGMAQYEVRGWQGWHHHIALCCLAQLFCLKERIGFKEDYPLLSVHDIVELLAHYIPRKTRTEAGVLSALRARHRARKKDIERRKRIANLTK